MRTLVFRSLFAAALASGCLAAPALAQPSPGPTPSPQIPTAYLAAESTSPFAGASVVVTEEPPSLRIKFNDPSIRTSPTKIVLVLDKWTPHDQHYNISLDGKDATAKVQVVNGDKLEDEETPAKVIAPDAGTLDITLDGTPAPGARFWFGVIAKGDEGPGQYRSPWLSFSNDTTAKNELPVDAVAWPPGPLTGEVKGITAGRQGALRFNKNTFVLILPTPQTDSEGNPIAQVKVSAIIDPPGDGQTYRIEADTHSRQVHVLDGALGTPLPSADPFTADVTAQNDDWSSALIPMPTLNKITSAPIADQTVVTLVETIELADGRKFQTQTRSVTVADLREQAGDASSSSGTTPAAAATTRASASSHSISKRKVAAGVGGVVLIGGVVFLVLRRRSAR